MRGPKGLGTDEEPKDVMVRYHDRLHRAKGKLMPTLSGSLQSSQKGSGAINEMYCVFQSVYLSATEAKTKRGSSPKTEYTCEKSERG